MIPQPIVKKAITVLIVDDHEMVRLGLSQMLSTYPELSILGTAANAQEALEKSLELKPDVLLLDLRLPDREGYEVCRDVRAKLPFTRVLVLTSYTDDERVFESIAAGANGYVLKEIGSDELVETIVKVSEGKSILSPSITDRVLDRVKIRQEDSPEKRMLLLTRQEMRVLALVAEGKTNKEVGLELNLSDKTVKNYMSNVMEKLMVSRRTEAAAFFARFKR